MSYDPSENPYEPILARSYATGLTDAHRSLLRALEEAWRGRKDGEEELAKARKRVEMYELVQPSRLKHELDLRAIYEQATGRELAPLELDLEDPGV